MTLLWVPRSATAPHRLVIDTPADQHHRRAHAERLHALADQYDDEVYDLAMVEAAGSNPAVRSTPSAPPAEEAAGTPALLPRLPGRPGRKPQHEREHLLDEYEEGC